MKLPRLIGAIHLPPLAGSPRSFHQHPAEALQAAGILAVKEATALAKAGFDGVILENFGDTPFYKSQVPPETVASMAVIAAAVREAVGISIGINILRNDARSALAVAATTGCDFIRVNVLSGVTASDQGLIEGDAAFLIRERNRLQVSVAILADVHVKHAQSWSSFDIGLGVEEVAGRGMADGVIVSGKTTGRLIEMASLQVASRAARANRIPIFLGSGATQDTLSEVKPWVDGIIVGSALRKDGQPGAPLDLKKMREFSREALRKAQSKKSGKTRPEGKMR